MPEAGLTEQRLLTVAEVAERLKLNPETIRRWIRSRKLRGVLMGGKRGGYRIRESDIQELLNSS